jgi:hypothetical protein
MAELVLRGGSVTDLAAGVAELLDGAFAVLDVDGRMLASVGDVGPAPAVEEAAAAARTLGRTVRRGGLWATAVNAGGESLCVLLLRPSTEPEATDLRILERAAMVTALLLLSRRSLAEAESRVRGELLEDLVSRPLDDPATAWERARRIGVDLGEAHSVLVLLGPGAGVAWTDERSEEGRRRPGGAGARASGASAGQLGPGASGASAGQLRPAEGRRPGAGGLRQRLTAWAAGQAAHQGGLAAYRDGSGVLLLPGTDPAAVAARVAREVGAALGVPVTVGSAGPVRQPEEVAPAYAEAARCAAALVALGRTGEGASAAELGFVGLLLGSTGAPDMDEFVRGALGPVLDYDARRGTRLRETLEEYFASGASPARAAEALHVHVNTVTQRLDRLTTLLGPGWQKSERALDLQLALRLHRLRRGRRLGRRC